MKRMLSLAFVSLMLLAMPATALAAPPVNLVTEGASAAFPNQAQAYLSTAGDTMVPLSYLDQLGIRTGWNAQTETATLVHGAITVATPAGTTVDGGSTPNGLNLAMQGGIPYVKLRSVANLYGLALEWDGATRTVSVPAALATPVATNKDLILATTTSTQDSGLLDYLLPEFEKDTGIVTKTIAVGSGAAIKMGEDGEADVLLVHSPGPEADAMRAGHAISRRGLMYNDYILLGPESDPAGVRDAEGNVLEAFKAIHAAGLPFISRGDNSGTDVAEKALWAAASITPDPANYLEAATGMLPTMTMADERNGYTLADRGTYLRNMDKLELAILCEGDTRLFNPYSVMVVNPAKNEQINYLAAFQFSDWLTSAKVQEMINTYGVAEFGNPLFFASYKPEY